MNDLIDIRNLRNVKKAKTILTDLQDILKVTLTAYYSLNKYKHYKIVNNVLIVLNNNKSILEGNIKECKEIIDNKGIV